MLRVLYTITTLAIGLFLVYLGFSRLTSSDVENIKSSFGNIHYIYIFFAVITGVISHYARSHRWKYLLQPMGYESGKMERFYIVMIGYLVNLGVPRLGEVSRSVIMAKRNNFSTSKVLGTIITERIIDLAILAFLTVLVFFLDFKIVISMYTKFQSSIQGKFSSLITLGYLVLFFAIGIAFLAYLSRKSRIISFITQKIRLAWEGIKTVFTLDNKITFLADTFLIWFLYVLMFYFTFLSLPGLSDVPFYAALTTYVIATYSVLFIQGGIGVYPIVVMIVLKFFNVEEYLGYAVGWVFWTLQVVVIVSLGVLSLAFLALKKNEPAN